MTKHKSEDYKLSAVKYFLKGEKTQEELCKIYECSVRSLMRWVDRYKVNKEIRRHNRKSYSYKSLLYKRPDIYEPIAKT